MSKITDKQIILLIIWFHVSFRVYKITLTLLSCFASTF